MYISRVLELFAEKAGLLFPVLLITGPRQVGKTSLLQHLAAQQPRTFVSLDDPLVLQLAKRDPAIFFQRYPPPLLIDEIQYAPELLRYLKLLVDQDRRPNQFWLTGSQPFQLMQGVAESLAGRVAALNLLGLSSAEIDGRAATSQPFLPPTLTQLAALPVRDVRSVKQIYERIWRGAFPAIALNPAMDRDLYYGSYLQTYIQRDIRDLARVGNEIGFLRFVRATAARTGQLLNLAELARDADIAPNTAKHWLSIMQASGLIYLLEPWHNNVTKRLVKTPKLYFLDTGLAAYLTEWSSPATLEAGAMSGAIFETWCINELLKSWWHNGKRAPFYFYRDKDQKEIDLLIVQDGLGYPVEIKKTASPNPLMSKHFHLIEKSGLQQGMGCILCLVKDPLPLSEQSIALSIDFV